MFRDDFEFRDGLSPSHLGPAASHGAAPAPAWLPPAAPATVAAAPGTAPIVVEQPAAALSWSSDAETELRKIPFFVRGKARRNTETFAREKGLAFITLETLYDAKAHFGR
jgi:light-independent protochlorophyllide reductase subunit B